MPAKCRVPSGTTEPWQFGAASFVPEGTIIFYLGFPSAKALGYFQKAHIRTDFSTVIVRYSKNLRICACRSNRSQIIR